MEYDAQNQLTKAVVTKHLNTNPITQEYSYTYDPFGRRVTKTDAFGTTYFTWDGNRLLTETRGESSQSYIYEQFGFTPLASIDKENNLHYYHNDHIGTPQEITNYQGEIVWEAEYSTWGNTAKVSYKQRDDNIQEEIAFQPLRFQGQYYDAKTGLHYNRFRYYDPDIGRFISQDPIGLLGGTNLYQYAPNPVGWVDPLGLDTTSDAQQLRKNMENSGIPSPNYSNSNAHGNSAHHIVQSNSKDPMSVSTRKHLLKHGININDPVNGVYLPTSSKVARNSGTDATPHSKVHSDYARAEINKRILSKDNKKDIEAELTKIKNELLSGTCPILEGGKTWKEIK